MRSLRVRLVLLSTLLSGVVIVALSSIAWFYMVSAFEERVDLEMRDRFGRMFRDLHPRVDLERYQEHLDSAVADEIGEGRVLLRVRDDINETEIFHRPESDWFAQLPARSVPRSSPGEVRPEFAHAKGPGPPSDLEAEVDPPTDRFFSDKQKGPKGKGGNPQGPGREDMIFGEMNYGGKEWRIVTFRGRGYSLVAAVDLATTQKDTDQLRTRFFISIPIALGLIALGGWFVADRALRPIRKISETASHVTAQGLGERIPESPHSDREITELIDVLNEMMNRLEKSFDHANRFSANVSHELKTPLAIMQGVVDDALKNAPPESREHGNLVVVSEEVRRIKEITQSLLLLSKADVGKLIHRVETLNLSEEVSGLVEDAEIMCSPLGISLKTDVEPDLFVEGDEVLLRQALLNLIGNAIKYNVEGGRVQMSLKRSANKESVLFAVENTGPTIPEEDRDRVFSRFHRVDKSRSRRVDGFGLGLSLASEIVKGHKGKIRLALKSDDMTRFEVELSSAG